MFCLSNLQEGKSDQERASLAAQLLTPSGSSYAKVYKISNGFAKRFVVSLGQSTIRHNEGGQCLVAASTTKIRSPPTTMTSLSFNFYDGRDNAISS